MSTPGGSTKVIVFALLANLGIALTKFGGAFFTRSTSLLAEAIHSLADCTNQVLLLIGSTKAKKLPDEKYPLGYGRESFFWSFLVAILLFSVGGIFAIYEGVHKLSEVGSPEHGLQMPFVGVCILVISIVLEGGSFITCLKEIREQHPGVALWTWFKESTSSDLVVIFMEDLAALVGLGLALVFLVISTVTGNSAWDAAGSIAIGVLLIAVSILLANEVKSLLIGESPAKSNHYRESMQTLFHSYDEKIEILRFIALATGSNELMVTLKVTPGNQKLSQDLIEVINKVEVATKKEFPEIRWLFVEPDVAD